MQRWLITGASGQLGGYILRSLSHRCPGDYVHALGHASLAGAGVTERVDLRSGAAVAELLRRAAPTRILHLAAVSPLVAESDPASCYALHVEAAKRMAIYASATDGWMLYASSDFVWNGNGEFHGEEETPLPANAYGKASLPASAPLQSTAADLSPATRYCSASRSIGARPHGPRSPHD